MDNKGLRLRKVALIVKQLNKELKRAADEKVTVVLDLEDISKPSDKIKRLELVLTEER